MSCRAPGNCNLLIKSSKAAIMMLARTTSEGRVGRKYTRHMDEPMIAASSFHSCGRTSMQAKGELMALNALVVLNIDWSSNL
jgi:hypothetical protein